MRAVHFMLMTESAASDRLTGALTSESMISRSYGSITCYTTSMSKLRGEKMPSDGFRKLRGRETLFPTATTADWKRSTASILKNFTRLLFVPAAMSASSSSSDASYWLFDQHVNSGCENV